MERIGKIEYYSDINELPIENYNAFRRQCAIQSIENPSEIISQIASLIDSNQKEKAITSLQNLHVSFYLISEKESATLNAFAAICKDCYNLTDEGLISFVNEKMKKVPYLLVKNAVSEVKKKLLPNLL